MPKTKVDFFLKKDIGQDGVFFTHIRNENTKFLQHSCYEGVFKKRYHVAVFSGKVGVADGFWNANDTQR